MEDRLVVIRCEVTQQLIVIIIIISIVRFNLDSFTSLILLDVCLIFSSHIVQLTGYCRQELEQRPEHIPGVFALVSFRV